MANHRADPGDGRERCFRSWRLVFGSRMSRSLKSITAQAAKLQTLAAPDTSPVESYVKEICELGLTVNLAQRAIWSFARFVPKEIVRRVVDNSISTELGGVRQEISIIFTDVRGFTTIAESADPDSLCGRCPDILPR